MVRALSGVRGAAVYFCRTLGRPDGAARPGGPGTRGVVGGTEHAGDAGRGLEAAVVARGPSRGTPGRTPGGRAERSSGRRGSAAGAPARASVWCAAWMG